MRRERERDKARERERDKARGRERRTALLEATEPREEEENTIELKQIEKERGGKG